MPNVPVEKVNARGDASALPFASTSAFWNKSVIADVSSTRTEASKGSGASGTKRTVASLFANAKWPETGEPPAVTRKELAEIVARSIASVNVTSTSAPTGTLTAPLAGTTADTFGGTLSGVFVRKLPVSGAGNTFAAMAGVD